MTHESFSGRRNSMGDYPDSKLDILVFQGNRWLVWMSVAAGAGDQGNRTFDEKTHRPVFFRLGIKQPSTNLQTWSPTHAWKKMSLTPAGCRFERFETLALACCSTVTPSARTR